MLTLAEVKDLLGKAEAERGELTYEQKLALEHARRFAKVKPEDVPKIRDELKAIPKIDDAIAVRIIDLVPRHADDVKALMAKSRANLDESEVQKVLETVEKYVGA